ncbi:MAG: YjbQ family protein [Fimbriimonadaceae bacterium]|nr:YjbQ family protein [Chitinophagales bacterium]
MIKQYQITLPAFKRGFHLIDKEVLSQIPELPEIGIMHVFIQHTSAGLTINENADPSVLKDYETIFNKLVPEGDPEYLHNAEGDDDMPAHIKATLAGSSVSIPITNRKLNFGTWQGIYLCEFRNNGGKRKLVITVYS